jgi:hypothetical protein
MIVARHTGSITGTFEDCALVILTKLSSDAPYTKVREWPKQRCG